MGSAAGALLSRNCEQRTPSSLFCLGKSKWNKETQAAIHPSSTHATATVSTPHTYIFMRVAPAPNWRQPRTARRRQPNNAGGEPPPPTSPATNWGWPAPPCAPEQPFLTPPGRDVRGKFHPGTSRGAGTQYPILTPRPGLAGEAATCRWCRCSDPPSGGSAAPDRPQLLSGVLWPGQGLGPGGWHMKPNPTQPRNWGSAKHPPLLKAGPPP